MQNPALVDRYASREEVRRYTWFKVIILLLLIVLLLLAFGVNGQQTPAAVSLLAANWLPIA